MIGGRRSRKGVVVWVIGALLAGLAIVPPAAVGPVPAPAYAQTVVTLTFTGAAQTWTVPAGVTSAQFEVYGAEGGHDAGVGGLGGLGGSALATLAITPGETLQVNVGGAGGDFSGGFNGGADAGTVACFFAVAPLAAAGPLMCGEMPMRIRAIAWPNASSWLVAEAGLAHARMPTAGPEAGSAGALVGQWTAVNSGEVAAAPRRTAAVAA